MEINCIAIDDEPLALDVIEHHTAKIPFLTLQAKILNPLAAIEILAKGKVDLMFVDIQMPELTGFELIRSLSVKPMVIFTTAYPNYALESYDMDAIDYLVKPISFERFLKSVNKVKQRLASPSEFIEPVIVQQETVDYIFVKTEYKTVKLFLNEILFVESLKDYVLFHLKGETVSSLLSIKSVESFLPSKKFVRVHRSFIIALDKIEEIERNTISISGKTIPLGESYRDAFRLLIDERRI